MRFPPLSKAHEPDVNGRHAPGPLISFPSAVFLGFLVVLGFHLAYFSSRLSAAILLFLYALVSLAALPSGRASFYAGLLVGLAVYAPQLGFFWSIFGPPAVTLWAVLAFWIGLFVLLAHHTRRQFSRTVAALAIPLLWMRIEYFRSELYYLRFGWLSPGFAFSGDRGAPIFTAAGVYGIGFGLMALASLLAFLPQRAAVIAGITAMAGIAFLDQLPAPTSRRPDLGTNVVVAGVQVEFPVELEVPGLLDNALRECPSAQLFMLSEYTFDGPVPKRVRDWCKKNRRYLVAGAKDVLSSSDYYNTAFVIGPSGDVVFQQVKSVPIQFFKDGFPAKERRTWDSPWGRLGICICYDLIYSRVTDELVRQGAQALLVPTMDVVDWGEYEHKLHARVTPMRAAEYRIPIFRIASSGVSQIVTRSGTISASVPFGQQGKVLSGQLILSRAGRLPWDRCLAPFATAVTALLAGWLLLNSLKTRHRNSSRKADQ
jgi:apolipoprotein N-acyltransferase